MSLYVLVGHRGDNPVTVVVDATDGHEARARALRVVPDLKPDTGIEKIPGDVYVVETPVQKLGYISNP